MNPQITPETPSIDLQGFNSQIPPKASHSRKKLFIFGVLFSLGVIAIATAGYVMGTKASDRSFPASTESESKQATNLEDSMDKWKTYTNKDINLQIKYPSNWIVKELTDAGNTDGVLLEGKEGNVRAVWGSGFGGGCDAPDHDSITFMNKSRDICHGKNEDGEYWSQIYEEIDKTTQLSVSAQSLHPVQTNSRVISQILSTFQFTISDQENTNSSLSPSVYGNYKSATGYSLQLPTGFKSAQTPTEQASQDNSCASLFTNNAGGVLSVSVKPYNGGDLKQFFNEEPSYTYAYKDYIIAGAKGLLQEKGPAGESGSDAKFVFPSGNYLLMGIFTNRGINDTQFLSVINSIKLNSELTMTKCGK